MSSPRERAQTPDACLILAAGRGSRFSTLGDPAKPLIPLLGLSLGERVVAAARAAGVRRFVVVLGHRGDAVRAHFEQVAERRGCRVEFVHAPDWERGNGASALAARARLEGASFLLVMADHLIAPALVERVAAARAHPGEICLAVDRDTAAIFDPEDLTRVALRDGRVARVGKRLDAWDAADTGVYLCTEALFEGLARAAARGEHALSDGVAELAAQGRVHAVDVTGELWVDVDTPAALSEARRRLLATISRRPEDGYVSACLNRRLSTRLSARLATTPVKPDQVTVAGFLAALLAALAFAPGSHAGNVLGALLVQLASVLDGCDGELARLRGLVTPRGAWLDTVLDRYGDTALAIGITVGHASSRPDLLTGLGGLVAVSGFLLASTVTKEFALRPGRPDPNDFPNRLKRRDLRLFAIFCGGLLGAPFAALVGVGLLAHALVAAILLRGWRMGKE